MSPSCPARCGCSRNFSCHRHLCRALPKRKQVLMEAFFTPYWARGRDFYGWVSSRQGTLPSALMGSEPPARLLRIS